MTRSVNKTRRGTSLAVFAIAANSLFLGTTATGNDAIDDPWTGKWFMYEEYKRPSGALGDGHLRSREVPQQMEVWINEHDGEYWLGYAPEVKMRPKGRSLVPIEDTGRHPRQLDMRRVGDVEVIEVRNSFNSYYMIRDEIPTTWKVTPHAREIDHSLFPQEMGNSGHFPGSLMRPYLTFCNAARMDEPWPKEMCLTGSVKWEDSPRPADRGDRGPGMNAKFLKEQFDSDIISFRRGPRGELFIRTRTTEMAWVQTHFNGWLIYQYKDKPLKAEPVTAP